MSVHSTADVSLVLGIVPRAPRLPTDAATLVAFAGPRSVRADVIRGMIADTLAAARAHRAAA
jgi:hypothetical protein